MGMYTEISLRLEFKRDVPEDVLKTVQSMLYDPEPETACKHALFETPRWAFMLQCHSYYHVPYSSNDMRQDEISGDWYLVSRSDFKNYDNEAELFFDWIAPYVEDGMMGYTLYEEDEKPTVFINNQGVVKKV